MMKYLLSILQKFKKKNEDLEEGSNELFCKQVV